MYLWKTEKLVEEFRNGGVSQHDSMKYFLFLSLIMFFGYLPTELFPSEYPSDTKRIYIYIEWSIVTVITIAGTYLCYLKNQKATAANFVERFICLSVPVGIRAVLKVVVIMFAVAIIYELMNKGGAIEYLTDLDIWLRRNVLFQVFFYWGIYQGFSAINKVNDGAEQT